MEKSWSLFSRNLPFWWGKRAATCIRKMKQTNKAKVIPEWTGSTGFTEETRKGPGMEWPESSELWNLNLALYYRSHPGRDWEVSYSGHRKEEEPTLGNIEVQGRCTLCLSCSPWTVAGCETKLWRGKFGAQRPFKSRPPSTASLLHVGISTGSGSPPLLTIGIM